MRRHAVFVGALLVLMPVAVVTWSVRRPTASGGGQQLAQAVPAAFGAWSGGDDPLDEGTLRMLRTDDYLNRTYSAPGRPVVTLTIVYSREERKTVHPPEVCFTGQGWEVEEQGRITLPGDLEAATLSLARDDQRLTCLYWYAAGDETTASYVTQQWNVAWLTLTGSPPGSAMVRLTALGAVGGDSTEAATALREVAEHALPSVRAAIR